MKFDDIVNKLMEAFDINTNIGKYPTDTSRTTTGNIIVKQKPSGFKGDTIDQGQNDLIPDGGELFPQAKSKKKTLTK